MQNQYFFPFQKLRSILVEQAQTFFPQDFNKHAELIVDLHLEKDLFRMPKMLPADKSIIQKLILDNAPLEDIKRALKLEDTATKKGMFRVLVRTHLNRSGISHVSMGFSSTTQSPRILNFTDSLDIETEISFPLFIDKWLEFAKNNQDSSKLELFYDSRALDSLEKIKRISNQIDIENITSNNLKNNADADLGWCRIVLGVFTGLLYLQKTDWNIYEIVNKESLTFSEIENLIKEYRRNVREYGVALAGSFLADLGSPHFVKDDTHVQKFLGVICPHLTSPMQRVEYITQAAVNLKLAPRALDKLMYLSGSGHFYLVGIDFDNPRIRQEDIKARLSRIIA